MGRLKVTDEDGERMVELDRPTMTVGRSKENEIVVKSTQCSRRHCQIEKVEQGFKLIDLESRNGTKVNGKFVNQHLMMHGDKVIIGDVSFEFDDPTAVTGRTVPVESPEKMEQVARQHVRDSVMGEQARRSEAATAAAPEERRSRLTSHRRQKSYSGLVMLGGAAVGLVGLMVVMRNLNQEAPEVARGRELYEKAVAIQDGNPEQALLDLQQINRTAGTWYTKAQELKSVLSTKIQHQRGAVSAEAEAEYREIDRFCQENPGKYEEILARLEAFSKKHEGMLPQMYLDEIDDRRKKAQSDLRKKAGGELAGLETKVTKALENRRYAEALRFVKDALIRTTDPAAKEQIEELKTSVIKGAEKYNRDLNFKAQSALAAGKRDEFDTIYQDLLSALKPTQGEEHPEYQTMIEEILRNQGRSKKPPEEPKPQN